MTLAETERPRGIRNNNPMNLRYVPNLRWQGQSGVDRDGYLIFFSPAYGIRAACVNIMHYKYHLGCTTLRDYVKRWAPPCENNTSAYLDYMCVELHINPDDPWDPCANPAKAVSACITYENGTQPYKAVIIDRAIMLAHRW